MPKSEKVHYIYKIHFLCGFPTGRYYLGKHTGYIEDNYAGSGNFCNAYYKKYGGILGKTYIKEILEINPSKKINGNREKEVIGDLWKTDPLCMNQKPGGEGGCGPGKYASRYGATVTQKTREKISKANKDRPGQAVDQFDLSGNFVKRYDSIRKAADAVGLKRSSAITQACKKAIHYRTAGGFFWRYSTDPDRSFETIQTVYENRRIEKRKKKEQERKNRILENEIKKGKKIDQYTIDGKFIKTFLSPKRVLKELNSKSYAALLHCCRQHKKYNTFLGYQWRFHGDPAPKKEDAFQSNCRKVVQLSADGNYIRTWDKISDAEKQLGASHSAIIRCCKNNKTHLGYKWKYKEE